MNGVRGELIAGLILRAAGSAAVERGIASDGAVKGVMWDDYAGRYDSKLGVRKSVWQNNLGRCGDEYIRVLELFNAVHGGERRVAE